MAANFVRFNTFLTRSELCDQYEYYDFWILKIADVHVLYKMADKVSFILTIAEMFIF